jgi:hypothetical protein
MSVWPDAAEEQAEEPREAQQRRRAARQLPPERLHRVGQRERTLRRRGLRLHLARPLHRVEKRRRGGLGAGQHEVSAPAEDAVPQRRERPRARGIEPRHRGQIDHEIGIRRQVRQHVMGLLDAAHGQGAAEADMGAPVSRFDLHSSPDTATPNPEDRTACPSRARQQDCAGPPIQQTLHSAASRHDAVVRFAPGAGCPGGGRVTAMPSP